MTLSARTVQRLAALFPELLGEADPQVSAAAAAWVSSYLGRVPRLSAWGLRAGVWALLWLPLLFVGRPVSADRLRGEERARYLGRWSGSRVYWLRETFFLVKAVALMGWGAQPRVRARLGLPPAAASAPHA